eukprot:CAMPEP_0117785934 /NCGR_PEP_ID=MMETSP0948-20121206/5555_1 /TAXON_ID=44440 /ORGANISM="Chattonella subsalsa, Strain CCMP2191" /LENGTH=334 /DNA_ID=CAMNT_0005614887 /DNA_START=81 /DNA_END=1085 /DNA_ORIENTATION=+
MNVLRVYKLHKRLAVCFPDNEEENRAASEWVESDHRPSDVILGTPSKSGTTWIQHILHQLRMRGKEIDFFSSNQIVPWIEIYPHAFGKKASEIEQPGEFRVMKTHMIWEQLEESGIVRAKAKIVYVFRDLKDVILSLARFVPPYAHMDPSTISIEDYVWIASRIRVERGLKNLVDFWKHRNDDENILFLFYDDMKENHRNAVSQIAAFADLSPPADTDLIDLVVKQSTHAYMSSKEHWRKYADFDLVDNCASLLKLSPEQVLPRGRITGKVRKGGGISSRGSELPSYINDYFDRCWERIIEKQLGFKTLDEMRAFRAQELKERPFSLNSKSPFQ